MCKSITSNNHRFDLHNQLSVMEFQIEHYTTESLSEYERILNKLKKRKESKIKKLTIKLDKLKTSQTECTPGSKESDHLKKEIKDLKIMIKRLSRKPIRLKPFIPHKERKQIIKNMRKMIDNLKAPENTNLRLEMKDKTVSLELVVSV